MNNDISVLIQKIKDAMSLAAVDEGKVVLHHIELARLYSELRGLVKRRKWEETLKGIGVSPRVANRYLAIAKGWWVARELAPDLLSKLPCDVHKLEQLSKLTVEQLTAVTTSLDCKDCSRAQVTESVIRWIGDKPNLSTDEDEIAKALKKRWSSHSKAMVTVATDVFEEGFQPSERKKLLDELYANMAEIEKALFPDEPSNGSQDPSPTSANDVSLNSVEEVDGE